MADQEENQPADDHTEPGGAPSVECPLAKGRCPLTKEKKKRREVTQQDLDEYVRYEAALYQRDLSNSENYDKSILMYATGALALSLTFIKDIVPLKVAVSLGLLETSWVFWVFSILSVLASFLFGLEASNKQRKFADQYYRRGKNKAIKKKNPFMRCVKLANLASGLCFVLGATFTTAFVWVNIDHNKATTSTQENSLMTTPTPSPPSSVPGHAMDGAMPPIIQKRITPTPAPAAPTPAPAPKPKQ